MNWARPSPNDQSTCLLAFIEMIKSSGRTPHSASNRLASSVYAATFCSVDLPCWKIWMITTPSERSKPRPVSLGDDLALVVLGNDLISITRRGGKDIEHDVLDSVSQSSELLRRPPFLDVNTDKWHKSKLTLLRHNVK